MRVAYSIYSVFAYAEISNRSALSQMGVATDPGATMMTSIPYSISSRRKLSEKPSNPCFEAAYAPTNGPPNLPPVELMLMIRPGFPCKERSLPSNGRNAFVTIRTLTKFFGKPLGVLCLSYTAKDAEAMLEQDFCNTPANAC